MKDRTKVLIAIVATALLVGGASAIAAGGGGGGQGRGPMMGGGGAAMMGGGAMMRGHHGGQLAAAATYLGFTPDALFTQLQAGKTLADVAKAQGKSVDGLKEALLADMKQHLDDAVAAGHMTADQAKTALDGAKTRIDAMVNGKLPARRGADIMVAAAKYLGLTQQQLGEQLRSGKSLAEVAKAQGKSLDGLKDALVASFKAHVDELVNEHHGAAPGLGFGPGPMGWRHP